MRPFHRAAAAFFAIARRRVGDRAFARASPPLPRPLIFAMYSEITGATLAFGFFRLVAIGSQYTRYTYTVQ